MENIDFLWKCLSKDNISYPITDQSDYKKKIECNINKKLDATTVKTVLTKTPFDIGINTLFYPITYIPEEKLQEADKNELYKQLLIDGELDQFQSNIQEIIRAIFLGVDPFLLITLSAECYESTNVSNMPIIVLNSNQIKINSNLIDPFDIEIELKLDMIHSIRKLLNIVKKGCHSSPHKSHDFCLVLKKQDIDNQIKVYGFGKYTQLKKKFFSIVFTSHMEWAVMPPSKQENTLSPIYEQCCIRYQKGRFMLPRVNEDNYIRIKIEKYLKSQNIPDPTVTSNFIVEIIEEAKKQSKGTGVIFMPKQLANKEVNRFYNAKRAYKQNLDLSPALFKKNINLFFSQTAIDGVSIVDFISKKCLAYGVILDGKCSDEIPGDIARGSRFNSINTYVQNFQDDTVIGVVISEDKFIDIIIKNQAPF